VLFLVGLTTPKFHIRTFTNASDLQDWIRADHSRRVHVLMSCDAAGLSKDFDVLRFREVVLHTGGISLILSNLKEDGSRRALVKKMVNGSVSIMLKEYSRSGEVWGNQAPAKRHKRTRSVGESRRRHKPRERAGEKGSESAVDRRRREMPRTRAGDRGSRRRRDLD